MHLLSRKRIKNYCPLHRVKTDWRHWKKYILEPLFPNFIFVYTRESNRQIIRQMPGVMDFVYWIDEPAVITPGEVNAIRVILKEYENVRLERVGIKKEYVGEMAETLLLVEKTSREENAVRVILPSLGYYLIADVRKGTAALPPADRH